MYGICEKCGEGPGTPYLVIFGHGRTDVIGNPSATHVERSTATFEGRKQVVVCDDCVASARASERSVFRYSGIVGALLVVAGVAVAVLANPWFWALAGLGIFVVLVGLSSLADSKRPDVYFGERIALRLAKPALKREGYNVVTTNTELADKVSRSVR
jgi:hypothetical protein